MKDNNTRRYPGVAGKRPDRKKAKQEEAATRQAAYNKLTPEQKATKSLKWSRKS